MRFFVCEAPSKAVRPIGMSWLICTSTVSSSAISVLHILIHSIGDPEAEENKEAADESKVPGADEVGPAAIEQGFAGNADWEVSGASGTAFAAASATATAPAGANWDAAADEWGASAGAPAGEWGAAEPAKAGEQW